jgi:hypothetical protein
MLRDVFGPLMYREVHIDSPILKWNDGILGKMATTIYEERSLPDGRLDSVRLAILADALEEAGCDIGEIIQHCRQQGQVHVKGCWVIDLLLGKS